MNLVYKDLVLIDNRITKLFNWIKNNKPTEVVSNQDKLNVSIIIKIQTIIKAIENIPLEDITIDGKKLINMRKKNSNMTANEAYNTLKNKIDGYCKYMFILNVLEVYCDTSFNCHAYYILNQFKSTINAIECVMEDMSIFDLFELENNPEKLDEFIQKTRENSSMKDFINNETLSMMIVDDNIVTQILSDELFRKYYYILSRDKDVSYLNLYDHVDNPMIFLKQHSDSFVNKFNEFIKIDIHKPNPLEYGDSDLLGDIQSKLIIEACLIYSVIMKIMNHKNMNKESRLYKMLSMMEDGIQLKQIEILTFLKEMLEEIDK